MLANQQLICAVFVQLWLLVRAHSTGQKMKFSIKDLFSKCDIKSHLLNQSLMENLIFCVVLRIFRCKADIGTTNR